MSGLARTPFIDGVVRAPTLALPDGGGGGYSFPDDRR
jgi:hypothetical protein